MTRKLKSQLKALAKVLDRIQWESMLTVKAPDAIDADEKDLAHRLKTLIRNAIGKEFIRFVQVREFSSSGVLHWHVVFDSNLSPELETRIKASVLQMLELENNRSRAFHYGPREDGNLDWPEFYVKKQNKKGGDVKSPPSDWDAALLGPLYRSHRVLRTDQGVDEKGSSHTDKKNATCVESEGGSQEGECANWSSSVLQGRDEEGSPCQKELGNACSSEVSGDLEGGQQTVKVGSPPENYGSGKTVDDSEENRQSTIPGKEEKPSNGDSWGGEKTVRASLVAETQPEIYAGTRSRPVAILGSTIPELTKDAPIGFCQTCFYHGSEVECGDGVCKCCGNSPEICCPF